MKVYSPILSYFLIPAIGAFLFLHPGLLGSPLSDDLAASKNSNHMNNHDTPLITTKQMAQVAIIVEDIEAAAAWYASLLGIDPPQPMVAAGHESRPTMYRVQPSDATAKLAFIQLDNIQLELIEPDGTPSIWQEFAEKQGQGIQHIAFWVDDIEAAERKFTSRGMDILQSGGWDGGAYSYIDATKQMGVIIELLHNYNQ
jgi:methylmalonyl-CoA/ethylmalonyl-CoA epimerase